MTSRLIRQQFLDFFKTRGHEIVPSSPIVVKNDPTLLFINAGMNQFKDYFLGNRQAPFSRVADTQKCLRVSGKHNDLEEVGVDTYHHTMFEMLGNWSFGDSARPDAGYFKKEAIEWGWELLTKIYSIPKDRLYVTIFEGDDSDSLPRDEEAFNEWKKWIPEERIINGKKKDNFWEMGDTGPCGPCTEIHVDCRTPEEISEQPGKDLVNKDHPQVIEIWNIVFIQFNRLKDGNLESLPQRHVDTGMGLERLVRVLQKKKSNYDTDLFSGLISLTEELTGKKYGNSESNQDIAFRVIADHIRAISFTIADGQMPSNTGAGYVIRRILRRAVRYCYSFLECKQPVLYKLVPTLADQFAGVFPELMKQKDFVAKLIREEEESFLRTLEKGLKKMDELNRLYNQNPNKTISGAEAFELYDTYGFPIDLTRLIATEQGLSVDEKGFQSEMQKQKDRSRAASILDTGDWTVIREGSSTFTGYDSQESQARLLKYRKVSSKGKHSYQLVLDKTPFYAESGGQVGDTGHLLFGEEDIRVFDTKKENELIIHFTDKLPGDPEASIRAIIDKERRKKIAMNHSATHLLHAALRNVLGKHVQQKGSLVNEKGLRFDFSHLSKMEPSEIRRVEEMVNEKIKENIAVSTRLMPKDEAVKLGAMALFGEKYGDMVRVVTIDPSFSVELCGGTHVGFTGELGLFKIIHETANAAGVRRIEAICGREAEMLVEEKEDLLLALREMLKNPKDLQRSLEGLIAENAALKKRADQAEDKLLAGIEEGLLKKVAQINGISFIGAIVEAGSADKLRKLCFDLRTHLNDYLIVLCANVSGKPAVVVGISDSLVLGKGLDAGKIIKEQVSPLIGGGGGGQKNLATAGGQNTGNLPKVIEAVKQLAVDS